MLSGVSQFAVDLIREHIQIILNDDIRDCFQIALLHHSARRVVGIGKDQDLGPGCDRSAQFLGFKAELILILERNDDRHAVCQDRAGLIGYIGGLRDQNLVSLIDHRAEHQINSLRAADRDQDLADRIIGDPLRSPHISSDLFPELFQSRVGSVERASFFQ